jgi:hypothetical protein
LHRHGNAVGQGKLLLVPVRNADVVQNTKHRCLVYTVSNLFPKKP